ncbi:uncharacterized protein RJT21DRAFT_118499, partial [Scheffersomyces amazonensis]|uniref:uncharacterized protein n=1 Tax=Scheffersomyces amazonensis TaxID=1078765 RepID=UPI00315DCC34
MNYGKLTWGLTRHLQSHVHAEIRLAPAPSNSKEVAYLLECFKLLGNIEFFRVDRDTSGLATYGNKLQVVYSATDVPSLLQSRFSHGNYEQGRAFPDKRVLQEQQDSIIDQLSRLIAVPRYSYIENDQEYLEGHTEIQFRHSLTNEGLKYGNRYSVSTAQVDSPFVVLDSNKKENENVKDIENVKDTENVKEIDNYEDKDTLDVSNLRKCMRHNFQIFHKFEFVIAGRGQPDMKRWNKSLSDKSSSRSRSQFKGFYS